MYEQLINFLQMGGYGAYVWTAYGVAAFIFAINLVMPWLQHRRSNKKNKI